MYDSNPVGCRDHGIVSLKTRYYMFEERNMTGMTGVTNATDMVPEVYKVYLCIERRFLSSSEEIKDLRAQPDRISCSFRMLFIREFFTDLGSHTKKSQNKD